MEYSHLPIKLLSCPSHISQFVPFVQSGSYHLGPQRVERRGIYSTSTKKTLWRHSSLFTFKHSFWCQLRSIEIFLHWLFKKESCTGGWETEHALVWYFSIALFCKEAAVNSRNPPQEAENGCQNGHGASPGWMRAVPCVGTGAYVATQAMDAWVFQSISLTWSVMKWPY